MDAGFRTGSRERGARGWPAKRLGPVPVRPPAVSAVAAALRIATSAADVVRGGDRHWSCGVPRVRVVRRLRPVREPPARHLLARFREAQRHPAAGFQPSSAAETPSARRSRAPARLPPSPSAVCGESTTTWRPGRRWSPHQPGSLRIKSRRLPSPWAATTTSRATRASVAPPCAAASTSCARASTW